VLAIVSVFFKQGAIVLCGEDGAARGCEHHANFDIIEERNRAEAVKIARKRFEDVMDVVEVST
jgi:hypothetical protein